MPKPPSGWSIVYSGDDKKRAVQIANEQRKKGYNSRVVAYQERTLGGTPYRGYQTIVKRSSQDLEHEFQQRNR